MKASNNFKKQIQEYLSDKALNDRLFTPVFNKPNKNIDDCITYVLNEVQKKAGSTSAFAMTDDEVYSIVLHYYDEDDVVVGTPPKVNISYVPDNNDDEDDIEGQVEDKVFTKENLHRLLDDDSEQSLFD